jgi:hypothetical protein
MNRLKLASRIPVGLAIIGAYLNSAEVLAQFQPAGRAWVGWIAALSVSVALFICVEAFLAHPRWVTAGGVLAFGLAEVLGQILHAALIRSDVVILSDTLRWLMGYLAPSLVVLVGLSMPFLVQFGFGSDSAGVSPDIASLRSDVASLADVVRQQALVTSAQASQRGRKPAETALAAAPERVQLALPETNGHKN